MSNFFLLVFCLQFLLFTEDGSDQLAPIVRKLQEQAGEAEHVHGRLEVSFREKGMVDEEYKFVAKRDGKLIVVELTSSSGGTQVLLMSRESSYLLFRPRNSLAYIISEQAEPISSLSPEGFYKAFGDRGLAWFDKCEHIFPSYFVSQFRLSATDDCKITEVFPQENSLASRSVYKPSLGSLAIEAAVQLKTGAIIEITKLELFDIEKPDLSRASVFKWTQDERQRSRVKSIVDSFSKGRELIGEQRYYFDLIAQAPSLEDFEPGRYGVDVQIKKTLPGMLWELIRSSWQFFNH